jgi:hypothetical protein
MAIICLLCLEGGVVVAQDSHLVYLPMTFHAEGQAIRTTACLQVNELVYAQSASWEKLDHNKSGAELAFKAVIAAIKRRDRGALLNLSDPTHGRDPKRFDQQATAFFQQFAAIEFVTVPRAYELDGLVVFFAELRSKEHTFFAPFTFAYEADGTFGFLPYRTEQLSPQLVQDWFNAMWGPATTDTPTYCPGGSIKRATHRVSLGTSPGTSKEVWHPSYLFLTGAPLDTPGELVDLTVRIRSTMEGFTSAFRGLDDFLKHMTPEGGNRVKNWFAAADQTERSKYESAIRDQRAFFVLDASPLMVVYTRSSVGVVQVMYFTVNANNDLLWTNSSHITLSDKVFKNGPLYDSALLAKPFSNIAIR